MSNRAAQLKYALDCIAKRHGIKCIDVQADSEGYRVLFKSATSTLGCVIDYKANQRELGDKLATCLHLLSSAN